MINHSVNRSRGAELSPATINQLINVEPVTTSPPLANHHVVIESPTNLGNINS